MTQSKYPELVGVSSVRLLRGYHVQVQFTDHTQRDIDLEPFLWGPVFEPIRNDPQVFASLRVDEVGKTICWPNGADIAPETLYYGDQPAPWETDRKISPKGKVRRARQTKGRSRVAVR